MISSHNSLKHSTAADSHEEATRQQTRPPLDITSSTSAHSLLTSSNYSSPEIRAFIAPRRTGSTLFASKVGCLENTSVVNRVVSRSDKHGRTMFTPNYSIFSDPDHHVLRQARDRNSNVLVIKEEFGDDVNRGTPETNECSFDVFPRDEVFEHSKPVIGFREPVATFASWKNKGWNDMDSFFVAYDSAMKLLSKSEEVFHNPPVYLYESFTRNRESASEFMKDVCKHWGAEYNEDFYESKPLGTGFIYLNEKERNIYENNSADLFNKNLQAGEIVKQEKRDNMTPEETVRVISELGEKYTNLVTKHAREEDKYLILKDHDYRVNK